MGAFQGRETGEIWRHLSAARPKRRKGAVRGRMGGREGGRECEREGQREKNGSEQGGWEAAKDI